jgi:hypothetical protein
MENKNDNKLYGVRLVYFPKILYFTASAKIQDKLAEGQHVITKTERGQEFGVLKFIVPLEKKKLWEK